MTLWYNQNLWKYVQISMMKSDKAKGIGKLNLWDTDLLIFISFFFLSQYNCSARYQVKMKTKILDFRLYPLNIMDSEAVTQRCSVKKVILEISQISPENTCARALVLKSILVNCRCLANLIFC